MFPFDTALNIPHILSVSRPEPLRWSLCLRGGGGPGVWAGPGQAAGEPATRGPQKRVLAAAWTPHPVPPRPWGSPPNLNLLSVQLRNKWFCCRSVADRRRLPKLNFVLCWKFLLCHCFASVQPHGDKEGGVQRPRASALLVTTDRTLSPVVLVRVCSDRPRARAGV